MADLPKVIQAQVDAADAMLAGQNQADMTQEAPQAPETPEVSVPPTQESVVQQVQQPKTEHSAWEQKYRILQGKYDAEVPLLHRQLKELNGQLAALTERVQKSQEVQQDTKPSVDPKDVESFGSDLVEMVQRVAKQMLGGMSAKVDGTLNGMVQRINAIEQILQGTTQTVAYTAEQTFFSQLGEAVPDYKVINADQRFLEWLGEVDPLLGTNRQAALNAAQEAHDARRVAAIFNAFKATLPQAPVTPRSAVEKQVSPASSAAAQVSKTKEPKVWTQKDIAKFYQDQVTGKYRGRDEEVAKIEAEINLAMQENRIR